MTRFIGLLLGAGVLFGVACTGDLGMTMGDSESTEAGCQPGSRGCLCTAASTCEGGLLCASMHCVAQDTGVTDSGVTTTDPTTGGTGSTTFGSMCDEEGGTDVACKDPAAPYCVGGRCVGCGQIDCAAAFPSLPVCDPNTGRCAACACTEAQPVCDEESHTCGACSSHAQCGDSACDMWTGACIPVSATLWVDGEGSCDDAGEGSEAEPLCSLATAFERIGAAPAGGHAVRVRPGTYTVATPLRATGDHVVALVHATGGVDDPEVKIVAGSSAALAIDVAGAMIVDGVHLQNGGSDGLTCTQGKAVLDRLTVQGGAANGLALVNCDAWVRRSVMVGNAMSGIEVRGGKLRIENSFVSSNGNTQSGEGGIYLAVGAELSAIYTTLIGNLAQAGTPFSVACDEDPAEEIVVVRNSVAINKGLTTLCDGATVSETAWSADMMTGSNLVVLYADLGKYLTVDPALTGVYRAKPEPKLSVLATWQTGDPEVDFDGDARPTEDGAADFAGADRIAP